MHIVVGRLGHASQATTLSICAAFLPTADRGASNRFGATLDRLMATGATCTDRLNSTNANIVATNSDADLIQAKVRTKRAPIERNQSNLGATGDYHVQTKPNENIETATADHTEKVPPLGFEPRTCGLRVRCSNQLS